MAFEPLPREAYHFHTLSIAYMYDIVNQINHVSAARPIQPTLPIHPVNHFIRVGISRR